MNFEERDPAQVLCALIRRSIFEKRGGNCFAGQFPPRDL